MKARLLKDIVIPAGTVFDTAASKTVRSDGHVEHWIGLSKNTSGTIVYFIGEKDDKEREELKEHFEVIEE